ncbi:MAG: sugar ABC transporter permease [Oscillospiraceae bacterium]|nr:sugar ABC transporter permease [Oscillospiraceae bacterium]
MAAPITKRKSISYTNWGYFFIAPFFIIYAIFAFIPLLSTFWYSLCDYYRVGVADWTGPKFIGLDNFKVILDFSQTYNLLVYFKNTVIIWLVGFVPQIIVSLLLASWFTDLRLKLKATGFFKVVIYLPNVIMAASISMLFFAFFDDLGPVNSMLKEAGMITEAYKFFNNVTATRSIIASINFLMWFGNTTILLMAAIMGVDTSVYESAQIDGANPAQTFWKITIPLIRPLLVYVLVTSLIGGIQMFDIPSIITNNIGTPNRTAMTVMMELNAYAGNKDYGRAAAVAVVLFAVSASLSLLVFWLGRDKDAIKVRKEMAKRKKGAGLL